MAPGAIDWILIHNCDRSIIDTNEQKWFHRIGSHCDAMNRTMTIQIQHGTYSQIEHCPHQHLTPISARHQDLVITAKAQVIEFFVRVCVAQSNTVHRIRVQTLIFSMHNQHTSVTNSQFNNRTGSMWMVAAPS